MERLFNFEPQQFIYHHNDGYGTVIHLMIENIPYKVRISITHNVFVCLSDYISMDNYEAMEQRFIPDNNPGTVGRYGYTPITHHRITELK